MTSPKMVSIGEEGREKTHVLGVTIKHLTSFLKFKDMKPWCKVSKKLFLLFRGGRGGVTFNFPPITLRQDYFQNTHSSNLMTERGGEAMGHNIFKKCIEINLSGPPCCCTVCQLIYMMNTSQSFLCLYLGIKIFNIMEEDKVSQKSAV